MPTSNAVLIVLIMRIFSEWSAILSTEHHNRGHEKQATTNHTNHTKKDNEEKEIGKVRVISLEPIGFSLSFFRVIRVIRGQAGGTTLARHRAIWERPVETSLSAQIAAILLRSRAHGAPVKKSD